MQGLDKGRRRLQFVQAPTPCDGYGRSPRGRTQAIRRARCDADYAGGCPKSPHKNDDNDLIRTMSLIVVASFDTARDSWA